MINVYLVQFLGSKKDLVQKCIWPKKMFGSITVLVQKTLEPQFGVGFVVFTIVLVLVLVIVGVDLVIVVVALLFLFFKFPDGVSLFTKQDYLKDTYSSRLISSPCLYFLASLLETPNFLLNIQFDQNFLRFWTPGPFLVQITQFSGLRFWENKWTQIYQENVYLHSIIIIGFLLWL